MKELVEYIAKSIVDRPEEVRVTEIHGSQHLIIELHVAEEDKGKVIGRQGRIIQAMRALLRVASVKEGKRALLEII